MDEATEVTVPNGDVGQPMAPVLCALKRGLGDSLVAVVLFGSRAREDADEHSDWDLLLIARDLPQKSFQRHLTIREATWPTGWLICSV